MLLTMFHLAVFQLLVVWRGGSFVFQMEYVYQLKCRLLA